MATEQAVFWDRVWLGDGCWAWWGPRSQYGYGTLSVAGKHWRAHRYSYTLLVGPIPEGAEIDHLCHNADTACAGGRTCIHRACANPDHLEAVSPTENRRRGKSLPALNLLKTHCKTGHELTPENVTASSRGWRRCRICFNAAWMRSYERRKVRALDEPE